MPQELENLTTSYQRITPALEETSDLQSRELIATLANRFWQRWTIQRGLVPSELELTTAKTLSAEPSIDGEETARSEAAVAAHAGASTRG